MSQELPRSLYPLALLAAREAGAEGFAIHQMDSAAGGREVKLGWGVPVPDADEAGLRVASFCLHAKDADESTGELAFVFRGAAIPPRAQSLLERIAAVIAEVWRLSVLPAAYARNAARIGKLETDLADSKISDRARGLLANGTLPRDAVDTIVRHVESVLRPGQLGIVLEQLTQEIEQEIAERELANRAKASFAEPLRNVGGSGARSSAPGEPQIAQTLAGRGSGCSGGAAGSARTITRSLSGQMHGAIHDERLAPLETSLANASVLVIPGWNGSGDGHWQTIVGARNTRAFAGWNNPTGRGPRARIGSRRSMRNWIAHRPPFWWRTAWVVSPWRIGQLLRGRKPITWKARSWWRRRG